MSDPSAHSSKTRRSVFPPYEARNARQDASDSLYWIQTVIQEARVFNETPISPRKCRILLTKIVYLLYIGETFGTQEATTLFFGVTKLFQHKDVRVVVLDPVARAGWLTRLW